SMSDKPTGRHHPGMPSWQRWEMGAFETPSRTAKAVATPVPDPNQIHAEVQRLRGAAQARGHAEGYAAGHAQGLAEGTEAGFKAGHAQGYDSGQMAGHQAGQALATQETDRIQNLAHSCSQAIETLH